MISYRLYFLDGEGRIVRADNIEAQDDDAARHAAAALDHAFAIEIWQQGRMVGTVRTGRQ